MKTERLTEDSTAAIGLSQSVPGKTNEDSLDAATAILDAASINPSVDQGIITGNDSLGVSNSNPIAMLNQEQIRCAF